MQIMQNDIFQAIASEISNKQTHLGDSRPY